MCDYMLTSRVSLWGMVCLVCLETIGISWSAEISIDLNAPNAQEQWSFSERGGSFENGELILDGGEGMLQAVWNPQSFQDVMLLAQFSIETDAVDTTACGFVFRAQDANTYYFVQMNPNQTVVGRSDSQRPWTEFNRSEKAALTRGEWHEAKVTAADGTFQVYLDQVLILEGQDDQLQEGRIGFFAFRGRIHVKTIKVQGEPIPKSDRLLPLHWEDFVFVCQDGGAGGYEAFPDVCRLQDGRLMTVFYAGYDHVSTPNKEHPKGGGVAYCTSEDDGRTWSAATVLFDGPKDDRDPSIAQLKDGRLLCNYFNYPGGTMIVSSSDGGRTWSEPVCITEKYVCSSPVRELSDGRLILGLYYEKESIAHGAVIISEDGGKSWGHPIDIDNGGLTLDAETDIIELKGGSLFAAQRGRKEIAWSVSMDGGKSWSVAQSFGFPGHCPYLHRSVEGVLLMGTRLPQTSVRFSRDEGQTWSDAILVDRKNGAYPSMVNLKDGSVLIVYYEEGLLSDIRAKRFQVTDTGLEWLPLH